MSLLLKLTLVIPTYNRQRYVLRNMRYWSGSDVTVHVLDGSEQPIPAEEMAGLTANVNYHHLPIPLYERYGKAVDLVQTEYTAMLPDDEFFLPNGLRACIQYLEADETCVACIGYCVGFNTISKQIYAWPAGQALKRPAGVAWENYVVVQDDPFARMIHHANPYQSFIINSVVRTPVWKRAMAVVPQSKLFPVHDREEFQFEFAVCYQGKAKVIQHLMWLRSYENNAIRDPNIPDIDEWWGDKDKSNDWEEFLTLMASALTRGDNRRPESVREDLRAVFNELYKFALSQRLERRSFRETVRNAIAIRLPPAVKEPIKKIRDVMPGASRKALPQADPLLRAAEILESTGVRVNYEQLSQIGDLVRQFHATPTDYQKLRAAQA